MQELGKFDFKIKVTPNGLKKYISFNTNNQVIFIDSFQFLSFSLDYSLLMDKKKIVIKSMSMFLRFGI